VGTSTTSSSELLMTESTSSTFCRFSPPLLLLPFEEDEEGAGIVGGIGKQLALQIVSELVYLTKAGLPHSMPLLNNQINFHRLVFHILGEMWVHLVSPKAALHESATLSGNVGTCDPKHFHTNFYEILPISCQKRRFRTIFIK
jgi:hypothetical protein